MLNLSPCFHFLRNRTEKRKKNQPLVKEVLCLSPLLFCLNKWFLVASVGKESPAMQKTWVGKIPWRSGRLPTPVFWPGEFHGLYSPWGRKESDMTERLSLSLYTIKLYWSVATPHLRYPSKVTQCNNSSIFFFLL